ncbi:hypothetical protein pb186bvf_000920 [Paramecium bursaria]
MSQRKKIHQMRFPNLLVPSASRDHLAEYVATYFGSAIEVLTNLSLASNFPTCHNKAYTQTRFFWAKDQ